MMSLGSAIKAHGDEWDTEKQHDAAYDIVKTLELYNYLECTT
jgi:hypothetical protein